jgi:hypothetical protein
LIAFLSGIWQAGLLLAEAFHDRIVEVGAESLDSVVISVGMEPVGEQDYDDPSVQVRPEGRAGKPEVPHTSIRKVGATA